jgi:hypothetical protein
VKNPLISSVLAKSGNSGFLKRVDSRIVGLTLLNALLYWPWHWLRVAYDTGDRHPQLVLMMMALTLWAWWQLAAAIINRTGGRLLK